MKRMFLVRGLPGAGKTTMARVLRDAHGRSLHIEADMYFTSESGQFNWSADRLTEAHDHCRALTASHCEGGTPCIIVANTFVKRWMLEPYIELAQKHNYVLTIITVSTILTDEELAARCVHGVPVNTITRMRADWEP